MSTEDGLVSELRELLGAKLVAYIGSVDSTATVGRWAAGEETIDEGTADRFRAALNAATVLAAVKPVVIVQAWFQGLNTDLGDTSPARVLREGDPDAEGLDVVRAAWRYAGR